MKASKSGLRTCGAGIAVFLLALTTFTQDETWVNNWRGESGTDPAVAAPPADGHTHHVGQEAGR